MEIRAKTDDLTGTSLMRTWVPSGTIGPAATQISDTAQNGQLKVTVLFDLVKQISPGLSQNFSIIVHYCYRP